MLVFTIIILARRLIAAIVKEVRNILLSKDLQELSLFTKIGVSVYSSLNYF